MSTETLKELRFNKPGFIDHFKPWLKPNGEPGDWYLTFEGRPVTFEDLHRVADIGFPRGPYLLTLKEVFSNYHKYKKQKEV